MSERLIDRIAAYADEGYEPFHMPGHKRTEGYGLAPLGSGYDMTELPGLDDLHAPEGILKDSMRLAERLFGGGRLFYLTGGSTCGILAAVFACCPRGSSAVVARNSHISVYHALELNGLRPIYVWPEYETGAAIDGAVAPEAVERAFAQAEDASAVIVTSPTYDGVVSDIASIAAVAHRHGAKLIVDAAHGAHLGLSPAFPEAAQKLGADITVLGLHKTLPALTGSAAAVVSDGAIDERFAHAISLFASTSPSYLLLASIDACVRTLTERGGALFEEYASSLFAFREKARKLGDLRIVAPCDLKSAYAFDPGKLLLFGEHCSGRTVYDLLRARKIEPEMYGLRHALCMTSVCDPKERFDRLYEALRRIEGKCVGEVPAVCAPPRMTANSTIADALASGKKEVSPKECVGRTACEYVYAYPPGTPVLAPGETVSAEFLHYYEEARRLGRRFRHTGSGRELVFSVSASE